jgi:hypothetical protein
VTTRSCFDGRRLRRLLSMSATAPIFEQLILSSAPCARPSKDEAGFRMEA